MHLSALTGSLTPSQGRGFSRIIPQPRRICGMKMSHGYIGFPHSPNTIVMIPPFSGLVYHPTKS